MTQIQITIAISSIILINSLMDILKNPRALRNTILNKCVFAYPEQSIDYSNNR